MASPGASIIVAPTPAFFFANSKIGDLLVRGYNGGVSQKILLGTTSNNDATLSICPSNITSYNATFSLSNDLGEAVLATAACNLGINTLAPTAVLDVNGNAAIQSDTFIRGKTSLSNTLGVTEDGTFEKDVWIKGTLHCLMPLGDLTLCNLKVTGPTTLGGLVSMCNSANIASNLNVLGATTLSNDLLVYGRTTLSNTASITSNLTVLGATALSNDLAVYGISTLSNALFVSSNVTVLGAAALSNTLDVYGAATLSNSATLASTLLVAGASTLSNALTVYGTTTLSNAVFASSNLSVEGATMLSNALAVYGPTALSNAATLSSTLLVAGVSTLSNDLTVYGKTTLSNTAVISSNLSVQGAAMLSNTLEVFGASTLSNALTVYGPTTLSNAAVLSATLAVAGAVTLSNDLLVYGHTILSNTAAISSNLSVQGATMLSNTLDVYGDVTLSNAATTLYGKLTASNDATFANNLTVLGSLNVETISFAYSNVTIYTSEEIRSNLTVLGTTTLSNLVTTYAPVEMYCPAPKITMSNDTGASTLASIGSNLGVNLATPAFTLDVNGDINFSGKIYQNGAIFSGWNSNAFGNYINSNAAFQGQATAADVLLLYSASNTFGSNLAFSMSNGSGKASFYSVGSNLGLGVAAPVATLDIAGDLKASSAVFAGPVAGASNPITFFADKRTAAGTVAAGVTGDAVTTGAAWSEALFADSVGVLSRVALVGSAAGVQTVAKAYDGLGLASAVVPGGAFSSNTWAVPNWDPFLSLPTGDALTSNLLATGSMLVRGSTWVDGSFETNQANVKTLKVTNGTQAFEGATLGAVNAVTDFFLPLPTSNLVLDAMSGDSGFSNVHATGTTFVNGGLKTNSGLTVDGDALMSTVRIDGLRGSKNFYTNATLATGGPAAALSARPWAASNAGVVYHSLQITGDSSAEGSLAVRDHGFFGGVVFIGSNVNAATPFAIGASNNGLVPSLSNVVLDCRGDVALENSLYVRERVLIDTQLGVGTQAPSYPVDVQNSTNGVSINCAAKVTASEFAVYSDRRIKTDILYSDVDEQLAAINRLAVCTFAYLDPTDKGRGVKVGFIAQEVEAVLPGCVVPVHEFIPNLMTEAAVVRRVDQFTVEIDASGLPDGALATLGATEAVKVRADGVNIIGAFELDAETGAPLLRLQRELAPETDSVFLVGTKIDDFKTLNYEQMNTIAIGAIQAQSKRIEALERALAALAA